MNKRHEIGEPEHSKWVIANDTNKVVDLETYTMTLRSFQGVN